MAATCWKRTWCQGNASAVTPGETMFAITASAFFIVLREPGAKLAMYTRAGFRSAGSAGVGTTIPDSELPSRTLIPIDNPMLVVHPIRRHHQPGGPFWRECCTPLIVANRQKAREPAFPDARDDLDDGGARRAPPRSGCFHRRWLTPARLRISRTTPAFSRCDDERCRSSASALGREPGSGPALLLDRLAEAERRLRAKPALGLVYTAHKSGVVRRMLLTRPAITCTTTTCPSETS